VALGKSTWIVYSALVAVSLVAAMPGCGNDKKNPAAPGGGGGGGGPDVTIAIGAGVAQADTNAYSPRRVTVAQGQTVAWKNNDAMAHTATAGATFNTGLIGAGGTSATIPMNTVGEFTYVCTVAGHNMTGFLTVNP
jgi:plastocyanin